MNQDLERLRSIKSFPSLVKYLRDELDWPIESDDVEDLSFDYQPQELGLDPKTVVKIKEIKQLRPFVTNQPWGIFYVNFEPKRLPIVALRRILRSLVIKKRASANKSQQRAWQQNDLLFISAYGETEEREISFAHFSEDSEMGDLPTLKVLGWNTGNTILRLEDTQSTLKEKLQWPEDEDDTKEWRERWSSAFKLKSRETVRTSRDLAVKLADLASDIRIRVNEVLAVESEHGELRKLYKAFQEALIHDLSEDDFADMYAQTIAYGLLTASISRQSGGLVADNLKDMVPNTNPFLKELMQTFLTVGGRKNKIDFDELGINEVVDLLRHTQMDEVLKDFGAKNPQEDPVIHFYELFLKEYDPEKRMKRGVFYTPRPVVSFIVRSVDEILRTEFGLEEGLADTTTWGELAKRREGLTLPPGAKPNDPFVQILDPATGTGTFLVEVIDQIYETLRTKWKEQGKNEPEMYDLWNDYVPRHLLPRLHGFELMMAPYAIAHMKVGLKLRETRYSFLSSERARIYLTNTLEEPTDFANYFEHMAPALAHEGEAANKVKRNLTLNVIIGNPPYSIASCNMSEHAISMVEPFRYVDGKRITERGALKSETILQDDYVKFIGYATGRILKASVGLVAYITNNGYLTNRVLRGVRNFIWKKFDNIYINDLHGNSSKRERCPDGSLDENVFDINQGVAISLFIKESFGESGDKHLRITDTWGRRYSQLKEGIIGKYDQLLVGNMQTMRWREQIPLADYYNFRPEDESIRSEYALLAAIDELMPFNKSGIVSGRDAFATDFDYEPLAERISTFLNPKLTDAEVRSRFGIKDGGGYQLEKRRRAALQEKVKAKDIITEIMYRPFDLRKVANTSAILTSPQKAGMFQMLKGDNVAICISRGAEIVRGWEHIFCSNKLIQHHSVSLKEVNYLIPLYFYPTAAETDLIEASSHKEGESFRRGNFERKYVWAFSQLLGLKFVMDGRGDRFSTFGPEDILHYIYATLHSATYRTRYSEFLKTDFPRIALTSDAELFRKLCRIGSDLVALHLLQDDYEAATWNASHPKSKSPLKILITRFAGKDSEVVKGYPRYKDSDVHINPSSYFEGVSEEVWNFHIGGYQVCEKWLKDRRGRTLSDEDVNHYQRVVVALNETIRLMDEIDRVIEEHGGWPLVGSQHSGAVSTGSSSTIPATKNEERASEENPLPFE